MKIRKIKPRIPGFSEFVKKQSKGGPMQSANKKIYKRARLKIADIDIDSDSESIKK